MSGDIVELIGASAISRFRVTFRIPSLERLSERVRSVEDGVGLYFDEDVGFEEVVDADC